MEVPKNNALSTRYSFSTVNYHEAKDQSIICSSTSCRSCTGSFLANCIALSCCPCSVVSLLTLTLVKVPWLASRRFLASLKRRKNSMKRRVSDEILHHHDGMLIKDRRRTLMEVEQKVWSIDDTSNMSIEKRDDVFKASLSSTTEAERVWMELYQIGHWGFGRVSFSGIQNRYIGVPDAKLCERQLF